MPHIHLDIWYLFVTDVIVQISERSAVAGLLSRFLFIVKYPREFCQTRRCIGESFVKYQDLWVGKKIHVYFVFTVESVLVITDYVNVASVFILKRKLQLNLKNKVKCNTINLFK